MTDFLGQEQTQNQSLPDGWERPRLGQIFDVFVGATPSRRESSYWNGQIPWVSSGEVAFCRIKDTREKITEAGLQNTSTVLHSPGTVLLGMIGEGKTRGQAAVLDIEACHNQNSAAIRVSSAGMSPEYVYFYLQAQYLETRRLGSGNNQPALNKSRVSEMTFPLPPLNEQRRIVEKIEELFTKLDAGVRSLKQARALLKSYRRSVLKAAVEGELSREWREAHRDELEPASELLERILEERREKFKGKRYKEPASPDTSNLPALADGWEWATWDQIGTSQNGRAFPSKEYSSSGTRLLRPGNLHVDGFVEWTDKNTRRMPEKWAEEHPSYLIGPRELVINLTAQSLADEFLGRVCLTGSEEHCLLNQRIARLTPIKVLPEYLLWMFKSHVFRRYVDSLNTGSLIQHMFTSQIAEFALPLPPLNEQRIIVEEVERCLSVVDKLEATVEANLKQADALRQSILNRAFSGELVPQHPDDVPASVLLERIRSERQAAKPKARKGRKSNARPTKSGGHAEQGGLF